MSEEDPKKQLEKLIEEHKEQTSGKTESTETTITEGPTEGTSELI